jgi:signal transduction histidine kinase/ligand-binding sensor domain-containing protein/DNA-binding response OmpR family regulator
MRTRYLFMLLFCLQTIRVFGGVELRSVHLTTDEGIANNTVRYIFQDSRGFIWLGTLNGLNRYDGYSFLTFRPDDKVPISLADHRVRQLSEDGSGHLWINTIAEQFSCYDLEKECFVDFTGCGEYRQSYGRIMTARNGDTWLYHENNGCRRVIFDRGAFSSVAFKKEKGNLPFDYVTYVYEDELGDVWIGGRGGVAMVKGDSTVMVVNNHSAFGAMSYGKDVFFISGTGELVIRKGDLNSRVLTRLGEGGKSTTVYGTLRLRNDWYIFTGEGGYVFHLDSRRLERSRELDIPRGIVLTDNRGNFWVYNHTGKVWYINAGTRLTKTFRLIPEDKVGYIDTERYHILHDSRDIIWISTYGNGLFAYDLNSGELQHFTSGTNGISHIASNFLLCVTEDRTSGIWVSSEYGGISYLRVQNEGAERIFPEGASQFDRSNTVRLIVRTANDEILIGTRGGGVYGYDADLKPKGNKQIFPANIYAMAEDSAGRRWLGSRGNGLSIGGRWYVSNTGDSTSLTNNHIFALHCDRRGRMWVGTFGGGLLLAIEGRSGYVFRRFLGRSNTQRQIRVIRECRNGYLWVGTSDGVYVLHPDSIIANPDNYHVFNHNNGSLPANEIRSICIDSVGRVWIGHGAGFSVCTPVEGCAGVTFEHYDVSDGLVNNMVQSIVASLDGRLWIATEYGISCFDPVGRTFENFFFSVHTLGNVYSENSGCAMRDGRLLFGSNYGLAVIYPDRMDAGRSALSPLPVVLTHLRINGVSIWPGDTESILDRALIYTDGISLTHNRNSFVIDFSSFDYLGISGTRYTFRLDNYDEEWSKPSLLNFASYRNVPPGEYIFRVKACNRAGAWGEGETVLGITIDPPFGRTVWAFLLYGLLATVILWVAYRLVRNFNALNNRIEIEKQLTEYKLVFFTNISHEFRTPLTLIQGALERIQRSGKQSKELSYSVSIMEKSTRRMLRLINQLLEFRKMQTGKLALSLEETDVMSFLHEIFLTFKDMAESKGMEFQFLPSCASYRMFIDKENIDKVAYNLLSNAFKYTPAGGCVRLSVRVDVVSGRLLIIVSDTGMGIPKEKRSELFKRFMQSSFAASSVGVGLHLTRELVSVHKGSIEYSENVGGGSVFTVSLPTDPGVYDRENFLLPVSLPVMGGMRDSVSHSCGTSELPDASETSGELSVASGTSDSCEPPCASDTFGSSDTSSSTDIPCASSSSTSCRVLIIEDDHDAREFLRTELCPYFTVSTSSDGLSGISLASTCDTDLIICDVLMPGLTGFDVVRRLKSDFSTSHIPIILLTALSSPESHLAGIESGADAYITKPYSPKLLLARALKLIDGRRRLREKFSNAPDLSPPVLCTSAADRTFADRLFAVIESQMDNAQFSVDDFASRMNLGRSVFYRKVRGVTGYSPNEYMRIMRIKKAALLLLEKRYTVSEVAYMVGFNDPFYFSKCFKQQLGVPPSSYPPTAHPEAVPP